MIPRHFLFGDRRKTGQDDFTGLQHGKVVSSQSINLGPSSFMTVYADPCCLVALAISILCVRGCPSATQPPQPYLSIYIASFRTPASLQLHVFRCKLQSQHDRTTLTVVALFYATDVFRGSFWIAAVRQMRSGKVQAAGRPTTII